MKGINFTEPLFHKVVSGEKTQTRRIIKPQPNDSGLYEYTDYAYGVAGFWGEVEETEEQKEFKPRYKKGETLYLKEPYAVTLADCYYKYGGDGRSEYSDFDDWKNKLFMPEKYARYYIKITDVGAERLKTISDEDCKKEGVYRIYSDNYYIYMNGYTKEAYHTPREAYAALIDSINGEGTWESNPYVWAYDFQLTNKQVI